MQLSCLIAGSSKREIFGIFNTKTRSNYQKLLKYSNNYWPGCGKKAAPNVGLLPQKSCVAPLIRSRLRLPRDDVIMLVAQKLCRKGCSPAFSLLRYSS
jgi:hypothetical protein